MKNKRSIPARKFRLPDYVLPSLATIMLISIWFSVFGYPVFPEEAFFNIENRDEKMLLPILLIITGLYLIMIYSYYREKNALKGHRSSHRHKQSSRSRQSTSRYPKDHDGGRIRNINDSQNSTSASEESEYYEPAISQKASNED